MKKIIIIGASSGMGFELSASFAARGWRVGMAARRLQPMKTLQEQYPDNINVAAIDVTAPDAVERFENLIEEMGGMDVLLYAAGTGWYNPELDRARQAATIGANVTGFTAITTAAFKYFERTANVTPGLIAAITSVAGTKGIGVSAAYSASKRYQWTFLQALDQLAHIRHVNVRFKDIRPGFVDTALLDTDPDKKRLPLVMPLPKAAADVQKAILSRCPRRVVTVDSRWAVVTALWRLIPGCLWRHLNFV